MLGAPNPYRTEINWIEYTTQDVGKFISASKRKHSFKFSVNGRRHEISITNSTMSGKQRVFLDGNKQAETKFFEQIYKTFTCDGNSYKVEAMGQDSFEIWVNGVKYGERPTVVQSGYQQPTNNLIRQASAITNNTPSHYQNTSVRQNYGTQQNQYQHNENKAYQATQHVKNEYKQPGNYTSPPIRQNPQNQATYRSPVAINTNYTSPPVRHNQAPTLNVSPTYNYYPDSSTAAEKKYQTKKEYKHPTPSNQHTTHGQPSYNFNKHIQDNQKSPVQTNYAMPSPPTVTTQSPTGYNNASPYNNIPNPYDKASTKIQNNNMTSYANVKIEKQNINHDSPYYNIANMMQSMTNKDSPYHNQPQIQPTHETPYSNNQQGNKQYGLKRTNTNEIFAAIDDATKKNLATKKSL